MGKNYYTFLVIPQKESATKKFRVSSTFIKFISIVAVVGVLSISYFSYDHIIIKGKVEELSRLEELTQTQKTQIDLLAGKVMDFEKKMSDLRQFDKKIRIMTNLDINREGDQVLGVGGSVPGDIGIGYQSAEMERTLIDKIHESMDELLNEANYQEDSFQELIDFLKKQKSILASTPSIWPVMGWVTSEFGYRVSPFTGKREFHKGIDIATKIGKEIVTPANGVAVEVTKQPGMGNMVKVDHGNDIQTIYGHLLAVKVKKGEKIKRGDVIGTVGNSGRSTGPHLHYGIAVDGVYVNPRRYLF